MVSFTHFVQSTHTPFEGKVQKWAFMVTVFLQIIWIHRIIFKYIRFVGKMSPLIMKTLEHLLYDFVRSSYTPLEGPSWWPFYPQIVQIHIILRYNIMIYLYIRSYLYIKHHYELVVNSLSHIFVKSTQTPLKGRVHFLVPIFFCYASWESLHISSVVTKLSGLNVFIYIICGRCRMIKCSSNQIVRSDDYDWLSYLPVFAYLRTPCSHRHDT